MKKGISIILILGLILSNLAGCANSKTTPTAQELSASVNETSSNAKEISFQQYISSYPGSATDEALRNLNAEFDSIKTEFNKGNITEQEYTEKMFDFDDRLRESKIFVPYKSLAAYTYAVKTMSQEDRSFVEKNYDNFLSAYSQAHSEEDILKIYEQGKVIYKKHNLNLDEMISSIQGACYNLALFKVDGNTLVLDTDRNSTLHEIDDATKEKYINIFTQIHSIVPEDIWKRVSSFIVFASGSTSAYAQFEDLSREKFRIGIDITSMLDQSGNLAKEQRVVIVHEAAHIITQNSSQISSKQAESSYVNANAEFLDKYQKDSYMYQFFLKFWTDIYEEYLLTTDSSEFYGKYEDQFVSDYAAMVPEEDIAESFRIFVMGDKPVSDSIKDQKVRFFYEYDEFVQWREEIRNALSK